MNCPCFSIKSSRNYSSFFSVYIRLHALNWDDRNSIFTHSLSNRFRGTFIQIFSRFWFFNPIKSMIFYFQTSISPSSFNWLIWHEWTSGQDGMDYGPAMKHDLNFVIKYSNKAIPECISRFQNHFFVFIIFLEKSPSIRSIYSAQ